MALVGRGCRSGEHGQVMAELAVVAPLLLVMVLGVLQLGLMGYGAVVARYAAFAGARAAAASAGGSRAAAARGAVAGILEVVPGVGVVRVELMRTVLRLDRSTAGWDRMTCRVRVRVPKVFPLPGARRITARAAQPMAPSL